MKKTLITGFILPFFISIIPCATASASIFPPSDSTQNETILVEQSDTTTFAEPIIQQEEYTNDDEYLSTKEKRKVKQEEKAKVRQAKEKERLSKKPTFEEFLGKWQPFIPCGDKDVDLFCASASDMVVRYKVISDSLNFIKIEVIEIPDEGDGITQAIKITDGNGNPRTKESIQAKWTHMGLQITLMAVDLTALGISGANIISNFSSNPENLLNFAVIGQLRRSIQAINMLTIEIRRSVPIIKEQTELMKTLKSN